MNIIEYWRTRRAMKALLKMVRNPQPVVNDIEHAGQSFRDMMLILQGKEPGQAEGSSSPAGDPPSE